MKERCWMYFVIFILSMQCIGCASFLTNSSSKDFMNAQGKDVGVIVGKLKANLPINSAITVRNIDTGKTYSIVSETIDVPDKNHYMNLFYCVKLPSGTYSIDSVDTVNANYNSAPIEVNVRFKVRSGIVQYFQTLIIDKELMTTSGNMSESLLKMRWQNDYDEAKEELKAKCPWLSDALLIKH